MYVVALSLEAGMLLRPSFAARTAGPDLWLAWAAGQLPLVALALTIAWLVSRFPEEGFVEYTRRAWGRWLGSGLVLVILSFWLAKAAESGFVLGRVVSMTLLPRTPFWAVMAVELATAGYVAWQGIGGEMRLAEMLVIPSILVMVGVTMLALPQAKLGYLKPVLQHGWKPVLTATLDMLGHLQGTDSLLLLFPFLAAKSSVRRDILAMIAIRSSVYAVLLVVPVMVLGVPETVREVLPALAVARSVGITGLGLERLDSLFIGLWLLAGYLPLAFRVYLSAYGLARFFGQENHRPFIWPVLALCALASAGPRQVIDFERYHASLDVMGMAARFGAIPLIALGVLVRGQGREKRRAGA